MLLSHALRALQKTTPAAGPVYVGGKTAGFVGATANYSPISLTDLTGGIASSPSENDLIVVLYSTGSTSNRFIRVVTSGYFPVGNKQYTNDTYDTNFVIYVKPAGASETSVTVSGSGSSSDSAAIAIQVWRGIDTSIMVEADTFTSITNTALINPPSITPVTSGAIVLAGGGAGHNTQLTYATPSDLSNFIQTNGASDSNDTTVAVGSTSWSSGAIDIAQFTLSSGSDSTSWSNVSFAIALKPGPHVASDYPSFVGGESSYEAISENTVSKPSGTAENDLIVLILAIDNTGMNQFTPPSGFTAQTETAISVFVYKVYTKIASASEPATYTVSWLKDGTLDSADSYLACITLRNATTTSAVYGTVNEVRSSNVLNPDALGVSVTQNGILLVAYATKNTATTRMGPTVCTLATSSPSTNISGFVYYRPQPDIDGSTDSLYMSAAATGDYVTQQIFFPRS